jgi:hypothetical protein
MYVKYQFCHFKGSLLFTGSVIVIKIVIAEAVSGMTDEEGLVEEVDLVVEGVV